MVKVCEPARVAQARVIAHIAHALRLFLIRFRNNCALGYAEHHIRGKSRSPEPKLVFLNQREHLLVGYGVCIANHEAFLICRHNPRQELSEEREGRVGDDDVCLVAQGGDLSAAEVAVAFEVLPLDVVEVDDAVAVHVAVEHEDLAPHARLGGVELRRALLEERRLVGRLVELAFGGVTRRDEFFEAEHLKVLRKEEREVAPFRVVAGQQHGLAAKSVGVEVEVSVDFALYVVVLRIKLVVLGVLSRRERCVCHKE